jgi:hypothetical protein
MRDHRGRRSLTPMTGELRATDDVFREQERRRLRVLRRSRRERQPPQTFSEMVARGLVRAALVLALVGAAAVAIAIVVGRSRGWETGRSVSVGLYVGGAILMAGAFFLTSSDVGSWEYKDAGERAGTITSGFAYIFLGLCLIGLGFAADVLF